ncbi:MAG TPA: hypothetical protein VGQ56_19805 [Gemmatimonadaceae bacterium]|nr:hypothetical protein [Gemmatimonadaceae bacterium]
MADDEADRDSQGTASPSASGSPNSERRRTGLDDPRTLDILTTEHWSLLSSRALGYQEMFGRATTFVAILSGTLVALALLAQAMRFGGETLLFALVLFAVCLFVGLATFVRCVEINYEDARWVAGMNLLRHAYLEIVPDLEPFFVTDHEPAPDRLSLAHGSPQHLRNLGSSLTTTSSVVAALNSALAGALSSDVGALLGVRLVPDLALGAGVSLISAALHVRYAARFRRRHAPVAKAAQ